MLKQGKTYCCKEKKNNFIIHFKRTTCPFHETEKKKQILDQNLFVMQETLLLFLTGIIEVIFFLSYLPSENNSGCFVS